MRLAEIEWKKVINTSILIIISVVLGVMIALSTMENNTLGSIVKQSTSKNR